MDAFNIDNWLEDYKSRMIETFGERVIYLGCMGSFARGEGGPQSDIDVVAILDRIETEDISSYHDLIAGMPNAEKVCGLFWSKDELIHHEPKSELLHFRYGIRTIYGTMERLIPPPSDEEIIAEIRFRMGNTLHMARHYLLFAHQASAVDPHMHGEYKYALVTLRWWILLTTRTYRPRAFDVASALKDPLDMEVARAAMEWANLAEDRVSDQKYYLELLEEWARSMLARVAAIRHP